MSELEFHEFFELREFLLLNPNSFKSFLKFVGHFHSELVEVRVKNLRTFLKELFSLQRLLEISCFDGAQHEIF